MNDPAEPSSRSFLATALIVIGLLWMTLTGLCTALVGVSSIVGDPRNFLGVIPSLIFVAVLCVGPGWLIWKAGKAMRRRRR